MARMPLTPRNFDTGGLRRTLRFEHHFEHHDLERAKSVIGAAISHVQEKTHTSSGLRKERLEMAENFLNKNRSEWGKLPEEHRKALKEWRKMPPHKREAVIDALKGHFGVVEKVEVPKATQETPKMPLKETPPPKAEPKSDTSFMERFGYKPYTRAPEPSPNAQSAPNLAPPAPANDNTAEQKEAA